MKYTETKQGRVFVIRLEDGDIVHEVLEQFTIDHNIEAASLIIVGGADATSKLVVGPEKDRELPLNPMKIELQNAHEVTGTGTIFRDDEGVPILHMHMSCGRKEKAVTGCIRQGVKVWHVMEVVLYELVDCGAKRLYEEPLGLKLLNPLGIQE